MKKQIKQLRFEIFKLIEGSPTDDLIHRLSGGESENW